MRRTFRTWYGWLLFYAGMQLLTIPGRGNQGMDTATIAQVRSAVEWYHYYYISLVRERIVANADFVRLFSGDTVRMANDFGYGSAAYFSRPSSYYAAAKSFLINRRIVQECAISLTNADDFRYGQDDQDIFVCLYKQISFLDGSGRRRRFASWERLRLREIAQQWKITEVAKLDQPEGLVETEIIREQKPAKQDPVATTRSPFHPPPQPVSPPASLQQPSNAEGQVTVTNEAPPPEPGTGRPMLPVPTTAHSNGTWVYFERKRKWVFYPDGAGRLPKEGYVAGRRVTD